MAERVRTGEIHRKTGETDVRIRLYLDGTGEVEISTGVAFLDHMLTLLARHGRFDLLVRATGDTEVDDHHTTEDVGIVLGQALREALGDKRGVARYGWAYAPMDETLVRTALDLSGRPYCVYEVPVPAQKVGTFDTELIAHFFQSLSYAAMLTLHVDRIRGENAHHILEAAFKSFALALHAATRIVHDDVPSTKGTL
jgi:imidazoleglycerol-phosphate dehydratase